MSEIILQDSHATIIDKWMEQERNGVKFPVDFDIAWKIAGYSRKDSAKRKLSKFIEGDDFHRSVEVVHRPQGGGSNKEAIELTCDAFKHFCLLAETDQGKAIRQYFIEAEKKWKLVEQTRPDVASEIESLRLQRDILNTELQLRQLDNSMLTLHGKEVVLTLRGMSNQIVREEIKTTEIVEPDTGRCTNILTADQLKDAVLSRTGQKLKSMKQFTDALRQANRDDLLDPVRRSHVAEYIKPENLDEAIAVVYQSKRQLLLGE